MRKLKHLMVSTDHRGKGGIATVVNGYHEAGLIDEYSFVTVHTHSTTNRLKVFAIMQFIKSYLTVLFYGVFYQLGIVHVHMASRGSYSRKAKILRLAKFLNGRTIIHLHGAEFELFFDNECSDRKRKHIKSTFELADKVIVLSRQWLNWVNTITTDPNKICLIYNSVSKPDLPCNKSDMPRILFLGRLGRRKGVDDLLQAFSQILVAFPNAELQLGGDGEISHYKALVNKMGIAKQVTFLGWIDGKLKNKCLADATIYCLPSYNEGFPMGVLEAMAAEVAVVSTTAGGIPDAIKHQTDGLLVEAGDVIALTNALNELLKDSNKRTTFIANAKTKYDNNFCPEATTPKLKNIYKELLGSSE